MMARTWLPENTGEKAPCAACGDGHYTSRCPNTMPAEPPTPADEHHTDDPAGDRDPA